MCPLFPTRNGRFRICADGALLPGPGSFACTWEILWLLWERRHRDSILCENLDALRLKLALGEQKYPVDTLNLGLIHVGIIPSLAN